MDVKREEQRLVREMRRNFFPNQPILYEQLQTKGFEDIEIAIAVNMLQSGGRTFLFDSDIVPLLCENRRASLQSSKASNANNTSKSESLQSNEQLIAFPPPSSRPSMRSSHIGSSPLPYGIIDISSSPNRIHNDLSPSSPPAKIDLDSSMRTSYSVGRLPLPLSAMRIDDIVRSSTTPPYYSDTTLSPYQSAQHSAIPSAPDVATSPLADPVANALPTSSSPSPSTYRSLL
jgi:hypothetical protein